MSDVNQTESNQPHNVTRRLYESPKSTIAPDTGKQPHDKSALDTLAQMEGDLSHSVEYAQSPIAPTITQEGEGSNTVFSYTDSKTGERFTRRLYQNWEKAQ